MARFGRSTPPSTRLRSPIRPDGPPPRVYELGSVVEQDAARPVNRAVGEVRQAREQDTALAVGRTHARTPGQATQADAARVIAGRAHRRDLGRAGETSAAVAVRRGHRRDTGRAPEYTSARSVLGDRPNVTPEAWAAAIESDDRTPIMRLQADWSRTGQFDHPLSDLTGLVKSVTVERSLATTLPANVGIVEGSSAASLTAELGGEWDDGTTPTAAFAPYRTDAAFWAKPVIGTPVTLDTGFVTEQGAKAERRFTGSVRRLASKSKDRQVTLDGLDGANQLRAPISLPAFGLDLLALRRYGSERYFARINSQWLIDFILRKNGVYASPPFRSDALIAATMHGSTIAERGYGGVPREYETGSPKTKDAWVSDGHPFGMLHHNTLAPAKRGTWYVDTPLPVAPGTGIGMSGWFRVGPGINGQVMALEVAPLKQLTIEMNGGFLAAYVRFEDGALRGIAHPATTATNPATWVFFGVHFAFSRSLVTMTVRAGGSTLSTTAALPEQNANWYTTPTLFYQLNQSATNLQMWASPSPPTTWVGETWNSQADIDRGMNEWWGIPAISGEDSWDLLREVVAAEYGACGFRPNGTFFFQSRSRVREDVERKQITSSGNLADLATTLDEATVRNVVSGVAQSYMIEDWEVVYEPTDPAELDCGPGVTDFYVPVADGTVITWQADSGEFLRSGSETFTSDRDRYSQRADVVFVAVLSANPTVEQTTPGSLALAARLANPTTLRLTIYNNTGVSVRFATASTVTDGVTTPGQPAFKVPGRRLKPQQPQSVTIADSGSIVDYGPRSYDLGGASRWRQHAPAIEAVASAVLGSLGRPVPVLEDVEVTHDPRRELFTPVAVSDPDGLGTVLGTITGIKTTYSASGAVDSLTVRPIGPPGLGVLDDMDLGQVGSTLVFGS